MEILQGYHRPTNILLSIHRLLSHVHRYVGYCIKKISYALYNIVIINSNTSSVRFLMTCVNLLSDLYDLRSTSAGIFDLH